MKYIAVIALVFLLAGFCGCSITGDSSQEEKEIDNESIEISNLNDFLDKYKRTDFNEFINNPGNFFKELDAIKEGGNYNTDFSEWELDKDNSKGSFSWYRIENVLFDLPVNITAGTMNDLFLSISFEISTSDEVLDYEATVKLCEFMFNNFGDADSIEISDEEANENALRKIFLDNDSKKPFGCTWSKKDENGTNYRYDISYWRMEFPDKSVATRIFIS